MFALTAHINYSHKLSQCGTDRIRFLAVQVHGVQVSSSVVRGLLRAFKFIDSESRPFYVAVDCPAVPAFNYVSLVTLFAYLRGHGARPYEQSTVMLSFSESVLVLITTDSTCLKGGAQPKPGSLTVLFVKTEHIPVTSFDKEDCQ